MEGIWFYEILYYHYVLSVQRRRFWFKFGILEYLSNNSSNELLMIGIAIVKNSVQAHNF